MDIQLRNIQIVRQLYSAFSTRDIGAVLGLLSEEVEWGEPANPYNPAAGTRRGHRGFLEWSEVGRTSEEILVLEPRKFLADDDSVAVVGFTRCRVKSTGRTYETDFVHLIKMKDGLVVRFQEFFDTFAAAEAFRP